MITMMKIMRKIKIIIIKKQIKKKEKKDTITTNKSLVTDKTLTGEEREKKKNLFITSKLRKDYLV